MNSSTVRKSVQFLAIAFCLMAMASLATLMGFGQMRSDKFLDTNMRAISEIQGLRESLKDAILSSQRFIVTGEKLQYSSFIESVDSTKQHLFTLKAIDGGQYGNNERFRRMANEVGLLLDQLVMDARIFQDKGPDSSKELLLTTRELRDASLLSSDLLAMEQEESTTVRNYIAGDSKARGNALPMIILLLSACSGIYALYLFTGDGVNDELEKSTTLTTESADIALKQELELAKEQLERLANVDYLTEVLNLRGL